MAQGGAMNKCFNLRSFSLFFAAAGWMVSCATSVETSLAKNYQTKLDLMQGQKSAAVLSAVAGEWKFELVNSWEGADPAPERIGRIAGRAIKLSDQEYKQVFSDPGLFKVMVFSKIVGTAEGTRGQMDGAGFNIYKDSTYQVEKFSVIRLIFRDDALVQSRVWPGLEQSRFVEAATVIRK
jgi:hypothetical protein